MFGGKGGLSTPGLFPVRESELLALLVSKESEESEEGEERERASERGREERKVGDVVRDESGGKKKD